MKKALIVMLVLTFGVGAVAQAQMLTWDPWTTSGTPPSPRKGHAAVVVPAVDSIFVFGGQDRTGLLNDLYVLRAAGYSHVWAQLQPRGTPPSQRAGHSMILVPSRNRILVFGGYTSSGRCLNDLWALDSLATGGHWVLLSPGGTPPTPRAEHTAVYDSSYDRMILYAGRDSVPNPLADLWALDSVSIGNGRWRQLSPVGTPPPPRFDHSAAYYSYFRHMIVFGGRNTSGALADLYSLDLTTPEGTWSSWNPGGQAPSARYAHVATYSFSFYGMMFLFGGQSDSTHFFGDTYTLDTQWNRETLPFSPAPRSQMPVVPGLISPLWSILEIIGGALGDSLANDVWSLASINAVEERGNRAETEDGFGFTISPNPTSGTCRITDASTSTERFLIYNLSGQLIRSLNPGENKRSEKVITLYWDGRDDRGETVIGGVYFIKKAGDFRSAIRKVVILR